jgi:hypothetical protein
MASILRRVDNRHFKIVLPGLLVAMQYIMESKICSTPYTQSVF